MNLQKIPAFMLSLIVTLLVTSGCIGDPGVSKNRGIAKDFSIVKNQVGCGTDYLILAKNNICTSTCETGTHIGSDTELATAKKNASTTLLAYIEASAGICVDDVVTEVRPTNAIDIKSDFCSCLNGKSDLNNDCSAFCASVTPTAEPTLYLNTIMGTDIILNTKLGNLYNWCSVQLSSDPTKPQCFLQATDGTNTISDLPVTVTPGSNSLSVKIQALAYDKTYIVKIVEGKTGSNAQSKEFQLRRKAQAEDDGVLSGALTITPINQYTCMTYGVLPTKDSSIIRSSFARVYYYFAANETPPPIPPAGGDNPSLVVCHDEQNHPGNDNAEYPRLELIPLHFSMWNKMDPRFVNSDNTTLAINKTIKARLLSEFGVSAQTVDLFKLINYPNRPSTAATSSAPISLGYIMVPWTDPLTGKAFCPIQKDYNGSNPFFNILKEYMDDTEGLYLAEKEAESIQTGANTYKPVYGTMFITETVLKKYGFYMENGLKIRADQNAMNTRTIYYYWPLNDSMDPLVQGDRKLYTVRSPDSLQGNVPTGQATTLRPSDKRIGCVPKSK